MLTRGAPCLVALALWVLAGFGCGQGEDPADSGGGPPSSSAVGGSGDVVDGGGSTTGGSSDANATDASSTQTGGSGGGASAIDASSAAAAAGSAPQGGAGAAGQDGSSTGMAWPDGEYVSVDEVHDRLSNGDSDMLLVNVVDEEFYDLGHIEGSLKIPWDLLADRLGEVDAERHVVIYCRRGVRSESAYETLTTQGYPLVWVMEGGIEAWIEAGYPTVPQ